MQSPSPFLPVFVYYYQVAPVGIVAIYEINFPLLTRREIRYILVTEERKRLHQNFDERVLL